MHVFINKVVESIDMLKTSVKLAALIHCNICPKIFPKNDETIDLEYQ
jgi:hypothetical protein